MKTPLNFGSNEMIHFPAPLFVIDMQADYIGNCSPYPYYDHELIDKINEKMKIAV